ncbi:MAG: L-histidine N(alpha)-methyltransferase [Stappiaceae bacterium]
MLNALEKDVVPEVPANGDDNFRQTVLNGLSKEQKQIPPRFFYDYRGSELFEQITELQAYYPTRTEIGILSDAASELGELIGRDAVVIEFGSGSSRKTPLLLKALEDPLAYVPIDISGEFLTEMAGRLHSAFPAMKMLPVVADFMQPMSLPPLPEGSPRLGFFPGSTIGNMDPQEAHRFLTRAGEILGENGQLLIGVDTRKDEQVLLDAYDDPEGITASFNLNLLDRINREIDADFNIDAFRHEARWNNQASRIEMHLVSQQNQSVTVADRKVDFEKDETIHTENSHKYSPREFQILARAAGWKTDRVWTDNRAYFSVHLLSR